MKLAYGYKDFWEAAHTNYPDQIRPGGLLDQAGMFDAIDSVVNCDDSDRFAKPSERWWMSTLYPKSFPDRSTKVGALALTYRGLVNIKTPFDLALYTTNLGTSAKNNSRTWFLSRRERPVVCRSYVDAL